MRPLFVKKEAFEFVGTEISFGVETLEIVKEVFSFVF